ncbi:hypothetical protein GGI20_001356 [Coemansia sp. BCRC 34301]|nr:hypothetical protein GGI20_001356 [Coemansia sp. BCRC 34301]
MVCVICYNSLFGGFSGDEPSAGSTSTSPDKKIAALSCGHTFHLACVTEWLGRAGNRSCPLCKAQQYGPALALEIACHRKHVADEQRGDQGLGELDIRDQTEYNELEAKVAALQIGLEEMNKTLKNVRLTDDKLYSRLAYLEKRENDPSTLSERHIVHIHNLQTALGLKQQAIVELEDRVHESLPGSFFLS